MRLLLLGAGEFGVPTFEFLRQHHEVTGLISQPDRPAGRRRQLTPAPAAQWAADHDIPVFKTDDVNTPEFVARVQALEAKAGVVIAFGQKLSPELIAAAGRELVVNLHSSLLPAFRGAAPINWAILTGQTQTGVSVISLAQQMDAGLIYAQRTTAIDPLETAGELHDRLAAMGPEAVSAVLDDLAQGRLHGQAQDPALATRARKLSKADSPLDFNVTAQELRCRVHGLTPWPGASASWTRQGGEEATPLLLRRVKVHREQGKVGSPGEVLADGSIACAEGAIELLELQLPGKRVMTREAFTHGHPIQPGDRFN
jgi:methionyl-tRNA formyltransferase